MSIIVTDLFRSKDRKLVGNELILKALLEDLKALRKKGLDFQIGDENQKAFFVPCLVLGDNLGSNSLLGFTESFLKTVFCRICYATPQQSKSLVREDASLLRTVEKYKEDVSNVIPSLTGVKELCAFNELRDFHVIENASLDLMHDCFEGICNYDMALILSKLIEEKILTIEQLASRRRAAHTWVWALRSPRVMLVLYT